MKKKLNLLWNLKFNFFSVAERPLTFFAYFLNAKKVGRRRLVIVPATAGGLPLFPHAASCSRPRPCSRSVAFRLRRNRAGRSLPRWGQRARYPIFAPLKCGPALAPRRSSAYASVSPAAKPRVRSSAPPFGFAAQNQARHFAARNHPVRLSASRP